MELTLRCLRDSTPLLSTMDPRQPELLYRCPQCGTRYDSVLNMLPNPTPDAGRTPSPIQRSGGFLGLRNPGIPAPTGHVEQIGRLVWVVAIVLICLGMLLYWSIQQ